MSSVGPCRFEPYGYRIVDGVRPMHAEQVRFPVQYRAYGLIKGRRSPGWLNVQTEADFPIRIVEKDDVDAYVPIQNMGRHFPVDRNTFEEPSSIVVDGRLFFPVLRLFPEIAGGFKSSPVTLPSLNRMAADLNRSALITNPSGYSAWPFAAVRFSAKSDIANMVLDEALLRSVEWSDRERGVEFARTNAAELAVLDGQVYTSRYEPVMVSGQRWGSNILCDLLDFPAFCGLVSHADDFRRWDNVHAALLEKAVENGTVMVGRGLATFRAPVVEAMGATYLTRCLRTLFPRSDVEHVVGPGNTVTEALPDEFEDIALRLRRCYSEIVHSAGSERWDASARARELVAEFIELVERTGPPVICWSQSQKTTRLNDLRKVVEKWNERDCHKAPGVVATAVIPEDDLVSLAPSR